MAAGGGIYNYIYMGVRERERESDSIGMSCPMLPCLDRRGGHSEHGDDVIPEKQLPFSEALRERILPWQHRGMQHTRPRRPISCAPTAHQSSHRCAAGSKMFLAILSATCPFVPSACRPICRARSLIVSKGTNIMDLTT